MSGGRKKRSSKFSVTGTNRQDILGNLTLAGGDRKELTRDTTTFKSKGTRSLQSQLRRAAAAKQKSIDFKKNTLVDLSQESIDNLNIRFKERANEVLRRNTFQGRNQLVLTNRI